MTSFDELAEARRTWLQQILRPWCQQAARRELLKAEAEWVDIAGKVDPEKTLWLWAWSRFPELVHESLGIEETSRVEIQTKDGKLYGGFPDARKSLRGQLMIWGCELTTETLTELGPFAIDDVVSVRRTESVH